MASPPLQSIINEQSFAKTQRPEDKELKARVNQDTMLSDKTLELSERNRQLMKQNKEPRSRNESVSMEPQYSKGKDSKTNSMA